MPELPEVETQCRFLKSAGLPGASIDNVSVFWERSLAPVSSSEFVHKVKGCRIRAITRRGKYICLELTGGNFLLVHLRMTGSLVKRDKGAGHDRHDQVVFHMHDFDLAFHDPRKFGRIRLVRDPNEILGRLGPEPLDPVLTAEWFHGILTARNRMMKPLLLDQAVIAGLGNIYVDESLFAAGIHPCRISRTLSLEESEKLLGAIRNSLEGGIRNGGTSLGSGESNFRSGGQYGNNAGSLQVFRKTGMPCPRCGTVIERIIVGQRSTHFCPRCQPDIHQSGG